MTKRPGAQSAVSEKKEVKKRVAFTAPKDAATRALLARNASESPLLRLPAEIRQRIYIALLGQRLIHIEYRGEFQDHLKDSLWLDTSTWWHMVCPEDCHENECERRRPSDTAGRAWILAHEECHSLPNKSKHPELDIQVLRTCRHVYAEANSILWKMNTFSFRDMNHLKVFLKQRTASQRRTIRSLRLAFWEPFQGPYKQEILTMALVQSLEGLKHLRINYIREHLKSHYEEPGGSDAMF